MSKLFAWLSVNRWAKSDSGHLPPLTASTPHSSSTSPVKITAQRNRRNIPISGSTTMLPARMAQTTVCKSLIAVSIGFATVSMQRSGSGSSDDNHSLGSSGLHDDYEVEE